MNLSDLCKRLANGRLSNLALVETVSNVRIIKETERSKVIDAINEALIRLYTRYILKEKDVVIALRDHIITYRLNSLYSESLYPTVGVEIPYILDLPGDVFCDDVIKILEVYDHDGCLLPLNDTGNSCSVFSPQYDTIQVPEPETGKLINVVYQAKHKVLTVADPLEEIILPDTLYGALEAYVAYLIFADINTDDAKIRSDKQLLLYERICSEVVMTDAVSTTTINSNTTFSLRGWR